MHREALERTAPPSVIVDESFRVLHLSESAGRYIQPSAGTLANDITELAREELRFDLRNALQRVFSHGETSLSPPIGVRFDEAAQHRVYLQVKLVDSEQHAARTAIIFFFEGEPLGDDSDKTTDLEGRAPEDKILEPRQKLRLTQSRLSALREEHEGANEELRGANEELQSINEELQTVNSELKSKLDSVSRAHSDVENLMAATDVGVLFLDNQLRIKRFTPQVADLFNVGVGDEGRAITDFTNSLNYETFAADAREVLRTLSSSEREVRGRNGVWYLLRLQPYRTVENRIDGIVVTLVDINERRRAQQALRAGEARIRAVFDGMADSLLTIDEAGVIKSANKSTETMFGYSAEELLGANLAMLMPELHRAMRDGLQNDQRPAVEKITGAGREVDAARKDGSKFPAELRISELRHLDERLFIGFIRDLSERRTMEVRLQRLHGDPLSSMAAMATALAHELNQPLSAAANYLQAALRLLDSFPERPPAVNEALDAAATQVLRAGRIVSQLHQLISRGDSDRTIQSLHGIIRHACELTSPLAKESNVEVILHLDALKDSVIADNMRIQQVLVNLIRNACEAMSASKVRKLTIKTTLKDANLQTDVIDTGMGIPRSVDADFFEPFASTKASGLGVGLPISRSIIESHQGRIWAGRDAGGGAKFSFTLPLAAENLTEE